MLEQLVTYVQTQTGNSDMITAAIMVSIVGFSVRTARSLPSRLFNFLEYHLTTRVTVGNSNGEDQYIFNALCELVCKHSLGKNNIRTLFVDSGFDTSTQKTMVSLGAGIGKHMILYRGSFFIINRVKLDSSGTHKEKQEVIVKSFSRNPKSLSDLFEALREGIDGGPVSRIMRFSVNNCWSHGKRIPLSPIDSLALNKDFVTEFRNTLAEFKGRKEDYLRIGLPHKLTFLIHGAPGSGKTSLIRSVATELNLPLCPINLSEMSDGGLVNALTCLPKEGAIVLLEDVDCNGASARRVPAAYEEPAASDEFVVSEEEDEDGYPMYDSRRDNPVRKSTSIGVTLSGLLNALDGVEVLDNVLVFLTTNHIEHIDPALYRAGRVDHLLELPVLYPATIEKYFTNLYPDLKMPVWPSLSAKDVTHVKVKGMFDTKSIAKELSKFL